MNFPARKFGKFVGGVNLQRTKFVEIVTKKQKIKTN